MTDSLSEQFHKAALASVKPSTFTIGGHADILERKAEATVSFNRTIWNGWGATAYARAWWHDQAVVPDAHKIGGAVGFDLTKTLK